MNSKQIKGIPAISIADGSKLGEIERAYFDPAAKRVVGFALATDGRFLSPERSRIVDVGDVHSLGTSALTLDDESAVRGEETIARYGQLIDLDDLTRRRVVTEGGTLIGQVDSATFDERTFALTEIEVSQGFFAGNETIPLRQIITIGDDLVVVSNEVSAPVVDTASATEHPA